MGRSPVQLDDTVKESLESLNGNFARMKTLGDRVESLIKYYHANEKKQIEDREKEKQNQDRREKTLIHLGEPLKLKYDQFSETYSFRDESSAMILLLEHWESSDSFKRSVLESVKQLR